MQPSTTSTHVEYLEPSSVATDNMEMSEILAEIQAVGEKFAGNPQLESVLDSIIRSGIRLAGGDSGSIMLLSEDGRELVVAAAVGPRASIVLGTRQPAGASLAGAALRSDGHVLVHGSAIGVSGPRSEHPHDLGWGLVIPLRVSGRLLGVLNISTSVKRSELPAERVSMLSILANQSAFIIEVARLYQDLARKERRLELFVDRFLRMQSQRTIGPGSFGLPGARPRRAAPWRFASPPPPDAVAEPLLDRLSARERDVLGLIAEGLTNKEIATRLCLSPDTVKNHVVHVIQKLGVSDRTQAAVVAIRGGLVN